MKYKGFDIKCRTQQGASTGMQGTTYIFVAKITRNGDLLTIVFGATMKSAQENAKNKIDELSNNYKAMGNGQCPINRHLIFHR